MVSQVLTSNPYAFIQIGANNPENCSDTPVTVELLHTVGTHTDKLIGTTQQVNKIEYRFISHVYNTNETFELTVDELESLVGVTSVDEFLLNEEDDFNRVLEYITEHQLQEWKYCEDERYCGD